LRGWGGIEIAQQDAPSVIAFQGNAQGCVKYLLFPIDWVQASQGPDKSSWSLSAQGPITADRSVAVANQPGFALMGNAPWPGVNGQGLFVERSYAVNAPSWGGKYPGAILRGAIDASEIKNGGSSL
jgi:hypothetical protein